MQALHRQERLSLQGTTFAGGREAQLQTLLGVPEHYAFAAMVPLGKPLKQLTKLRRKPVASIAFKEHFDGEPLV